MKVDETKPVGPPAPTRRNAKSVSPSDEGSQYEGSAGGLDGARVESGVSDDIAAFHGLDGEDLTDRARMAMMELIEEVAQLRQELARNRRRIDYLTTLADEDPLSGVLNRRAFLRELSHAQILARENVTQNVLAFFAVADLGAVNAAHGHAAGDAAVEHVALILRQNVDEADVVGRLGGAEFAVVFVASEVERARERAEWLARLVDSRPLFRDEGQVQLKSAWAVHPLDPAEAAEDALGAAERDLPA